MYRVEIFYYPKKTTTEKKNPKKHLLFLYTYCVKSIDLMWANKGSKNTHNIITNNLYK